MALSTSETKAQNKVLLPEPAARILNISLQVQLGVQQNLCGHTNSYVVLCFVSPLNSLLALKVIYKCQSSKPSGERGKIGHHSGVAIELLYTLYKKAFKRKKFCSSYSKLNT